MTLAKWFVIIGNKPKERMRGGSALCQPLYESDRIVSTFTLTTVDREKMSAKFWLYPDVSLAENHGYNRKELRDIERIAREKLEGLRNEWDTF